MANPKAVLSAKLILALTATGPMACFALWFLVTGAVALWGPDAVLRGQALLALCVGGVVLLVRYGVERAPRL